MTNALPRNGRVWSGLIQTILTLGLTTSLPLVARSATTTNVSVDDNFFSPATVTIIVNDSVKWNWIGGNTHSSTSDTAGLWDSGLGTAPKTFTNAFPSIGTFPYHCNNHGSQDGTVIVQNVPNTPPTVTITNPANSAVFSASATFILGATATDSNGSVTNVQLRQGTTILTNRAIVPYTFLVTNLAVGSYTFFAIASDNANAKATNSVAITVNALPTVSITNPANGAILSAPATVAIMATATDSDGSITNVQILQGITSLTNRTSVPYSVTVSNLVSGNYTFSAVASDNRGAKATNSITITVNNSPTVTITNPPNGSILSAPATLTIMASPADSDGTVTNVQFLQGASTLTNRSAPPYSATASGVAAGTYNFSAVVSDNFGAKATNSISVNVVTPVAIVLSAPGQVSGTNFQFNYSANLGLKYIVQQSANLTSWTTLQTYTAAGNPVTFVRTNATASPGLYRVGRLPNP